MSGQTRTEEGTILPSEAVLRILTIEKEIDSLQNKLEELRIERKRLLERNPKAASMVGNITRMDRRVGEETKFVSTSSSSQVSEKVPIAKRAQEEEKVRKVTTPKKRPRPEKKKSQEEIERDSALKKLKKPIQSSSLHDLTKERIDATFTK